MSDEPKTTGEHPATNIEIGRKLNLQTGVILLSLVGTLLGGAKYLVVATWASGKETVDAGLSVLDAKLSAHVQEESASRKIIIEQVVDHLVELREMRQEQRAIYDYMKTGREHHELETPLPPLRDAGR